MVDNGTLFGIALAQLNVLVVKAHVVILHGAGSHLQIRSARLVLDIRRGREHLVHALKAGDGLLIRFGRIDECLERRAEQRNIECKGRHIDRLQLSLGDQPAAQQHHDHIEHTREQAIRRGIDAHGVIHVLLGRKIAIVGGAELEAFGLLIGKTLDHAHARQRILQLRIDAADLFAVVAKDLAHAHVLPKHDDRKRRRHHGHGERQHRGDGKEDHKRADNLDAADDDPLGHVVRRLADIEQVVDHAAHHVARAVAVKVRKAKALILVKQVLAHLGLHARAHHVTPIAHKIAAGAADDIHQHQTYRDHTERLHNGSMTLGKQPTGQIAQNNRKRKVNGGKHQSTNSIGNKKPHLGLVIRKKPFKHNHLTRFYQTAFRLDAASAPFGQSGLQSSVAYIHTLPSSFRPPCLKWSAFADLHKPVGSSPLVKVRSRPSGARCYRRQERPRRSWRLRSCRRVRRRSTRAAAPGPR